MDIEPLPITSFLQTSFSRRKTREMLDTLFEDWHNSISFALLIKISSGINQTQRSKPPTKKNRTARSNFIQNQPYLFFFFLNGSYIPKIKIGSESLILGSKGAREHEGRFKGWGRKTPVQTILFSLFHPSLKPQIWAICVERSISPSDKGLIARSRVNDKCHVKINQSQSIWKSTHM